MNTMKRLKQDHEWFRSRLTILESAVNLGSDTWFVLRELCFALSRQLRDHSRCEMELTALYTVRGGHNGCGNANLSHEEAQQQLPDINRFFAEQPSCLFERVRPTLMTFIARLHREIRDQESRLFPALEETSALHEHAQQHDEPMPPILSERMTIEDLASRYPMTQGVLELLFGQSAFERCDPLVEVAWRHGMNGQSVLEFLGQLIVGTRRATYKGGECSAPSD